jgi:hypothetical protein
LPCPLDRGRSIEQLRSEMQTDDGKKALLDEVAAFGAELESFVQAG